MSIKAQWIESRTSTIQKSDFSDLLYNILVLPLNLESMTAAWCKDIPYIQKKSRYAQMTPNAQPIIKKPA